jgi:hypothetical protein
VENIQFKSTDPLLKGIMIASCVIVALAVILFVVYKISLGGVVSNLDELT